MTLQIPIRKPETQLFFPMQLKQMTDEETKEYHLKKLQELIIKSLEKNPKLEDPNEEQRQKMLAIWTREETY